MTTPPWHIHTAPASFPAPPEPMGPGRAPAPERWRGLPCQGYAKASCEHCAAYQVSLLLELCLARQRLGLVRVRLRLRLGVGVGYNLLFCWFCSALPGTGERLGLCRLACAETNVAQPTASWLSGVCFQHHASGSSSVVQPWPTSRFGRQLVQPHWPAIPPPSWPAILAVFRHRARPWVSSAAPSLAPPCTLQPWPRTQWCPPPTRPADQGGRGLRAPPPMWKQGGSDLGQLALGGLCQLRIVLQAALSSGRPRPICRLGRTGCKYWPCFPHSPPAACPTMLRRETACSPLPVGCCCCATHVMPVRVVARADGRTNAWRGASITNTAKSRVIWLPSARVVAVERVSISEFRAGHLPGYPGV